MTNIEMAMAAPVLPAETKAEALPSRTSSAATRSDESRLRRSACEGLSAMPTTWEAWRISTAEAPGAQPVPARASMAVWSPTRMTEAPNSCAADDRALDDHGRAVVASHGVDGDLHARRTRSG